VEIDTFFSDPENLERSENRNEQRFEGGIWNSGNWEHLMVFQPE